MKFCAKEVVSVIRMGIDLGSGWIKCTIMNTVTREQLYEKSVNYKLIKSLDGNGNIPQQKINETIQIIDDFLKEAKKYDCTDVRAVATAGLRAAENSDEFIDKICNATGVRIRVISGAKEAKYTWKGALMSFDNRDERLYVEIDIGGGSTEITYGTKNHIFSSRSIDVGNTVLMQKFNLANRVVSDSEINGVMYYLDKQFSSVRVPYNKNNVYILTGSSGFLPLIRNNPSLTDKIIKSRPLWTITIDMVRDLMKELQNPNLYSYSKLISDIDLSADVILYFIMRKLGIDSINYSTVGLRHGLVLSEAAHA